MGLALLFTAVATYSAWRYAQSRQSVSLMTGVVAIILLGAVARVAASNDPPRFEGSLAPFEGTDDLTEFLRRSEERIVHLSVSVTADKFVELEELYPSKKTDPSILTIWGSCDTPRKGQGPRD
jgi:hypothetical protein